MLQTSPGGAAACNRRTRALRLAIRLAPPVSIVRIRAKRDRPQTLAARSIGFDLSQATSFRRFRVEIPPKAAFAADANPGLMSPGSGTEIWRTLLAAGVRLGQCAFAQSDGRLLRPLVRPMAWVPGRPGGFDPPWSSVMGEPSVGRRFPIAPCGTTASRRAQRPLAHLRQPRG